MTATTTSRRVEEAHSKRRFEFVVNTGATLYQGALCALNSSGLLVDATETTGIGPFFIVTGDMGPNNPASGTKRFGLTTEGVLTSAAAGTTVMVESGKFWLENGESIDDTDVGAAAYCDDNQTVKTTSTGTSQVGVIVEVDSDLGVLVDFWSTDAVVAAGSIDTAELADGAVTPVKHATTRYRSVASDGALAIINTDEMIHLIGSASGTKAATLTSAVEGQRLKLYLAARSGGSYTVACENPSGTSGTLTLDAAAEAPELAYDGSAWVVMDLGGASFA